MILNTLLSVFSIYPWNIGASAYYTFGDYSNGNQSQSTAVYWSMDERQKNGFVLGYEELLVSSESGDYEQYNLLTKDVFWIKNQFRLLGLAGRMTSNASDNGWFLGGMIEGELKWFGYSLGFIQSNFQQWHMLSDFIAEWEDVHINQINGVLSRQIGQVTISVGQQYQEFQDVTLGIGSLSLSGYFFKKLRLTFSGSLGESRYSIDPYSLILNNNPELLKKNISGRLVYRINPNWYIHAVFSHHEYESEQSINYSSFGIQCRF